MSSRFESCIEALLNQNIVCEVSNSDSFSYLDTPENEESVNNFLHRIGRNVVRTNDRKGYYCVFNSIEDKAKRSAVEKYFEYVKLCRAAGIDIPIVPGLKPITKKYQLQAIPRRFFVNLPDDLVKSIESADTPEKVREAGIEWCIHQSRELKENGVPCIHYYTMGDAATIRKIVSAIA